MDIEELITFNEHSRLLVMHSWRKEIPQPQRSIIIAEALNSCVIDCDFHIAGYLITNRRVFLIGSSETTPFQKIIQHFYKKVAEGISHYKKQTHPYADEYHLKHSHTLFTAYPFYNTHIRLLITGKNVTSSYYDQNLE